ncbi:hypothetical protein [Streptomyces sp. NBC_01198]|uniref:hypothetical protein n=1 Tax=Streptomyces sp. NBC_01198 TaxID=2903769 RepID=UPI002E12B436|nr:hypothetical protein OG702_26720 [Streptomyces sp. NBC_01198]
MYTNHPRKAVAHSLTTCVPGELRHSAHRMPALEVAVTVRAARRNRHKTFDAVNVYTTTDRTGAGLIVAYVHYRPGFYDGVTDYADVYEIPTDALTDL